MDSQVANALAQRIIDNPVSRTFFQRAVRIAFQDDPKTAVVLSFSADGGLSLQQYHADDPSLEEVPCRLEFTPESLRSVANGGACNDPPDITGSDEAVARQIMMILGIQDGQTQLGPGGVGQQGGSFEMAREMVLDTQLSADRQVFSVFNARDPGPYDLRHLRIEAGMTAEGVHFAVSVGLTDPATPLPPPPSEQRQVTGAGHELILMTDHAGAAGHAHVAALAMAMRQVANDERAFRDPDWIDYSRPLWRGGYCEGFIVTESRYLESPLPLHGGAWGRFYTLIGLCRDELDLLNTQKEPRKVLRVLESEFGNHELTDPFRDPVNLW